MKRLLSILFVILFPQSGYSEDTWNKLEQALVSDIRSAEEKQRDANRLPVETLKFVGLRSDMRVLELFPGTGWYTKLLAPVLRDEGKLYAAMMTRSIQQTIEKYPALNNVEILDVNADMPMTEVRGIFDLNPLSFFVENLDLVLTFRNAHNLTAEGRESLNEAVYDSLKPGGLYAVVDHTRRHMEPLTAENRRRTDPVAIIKECLDAGFEFVNYSDLHRRDADKLNLEVGDKSVTGQTDRYTLLFRKPV